MGHGEDSRDAPAPAAAQQRPGGGAKKKKKLLRGKVRAVRGVQNLSAVREGLLRKCLSDEWR
jgi:hypothetical protein